MASLKSFLDQKFKIKDLGHVHYFLGLEVTSTAQGYAISQCKYTTDLLDEFKYDFFSPVVAPLDSSINLNVDMGAPLSDPSLCRCLVGKLNFLQHTHPDIVFFGSTYDPISTTASSASYVGCSSCFSLFA